MRDRKQIFFNAEATSITSLNDKGEFDVLGSHANFTSIISDFVIIDKGLPSEQKFEIEQGVLNVKANSLRIYVGFGVKEEAIATKDTAKVIKDPR